MKSLSIIIMFALATTLFAQTGFRSTPFTNHPILVQAGLNLSTFSTTDHDDLYWDFSIKPGLKAGLETYFGPLNLDLTYQQLGNDMTSTDYQDFDGDGEQDPNPQNIPSLEVSIRLNYITFGVSVPYYLTTKLAILPGFVLGYTLNGTFEITSTDTTGLSEVYSADAEADDFNLDHAITAGLQWDATARLHLRFTYYYAFKDYWYDQATNPNNRNRAYSFTVLYHIPYK
jgi:hypothetical protein